MWSGTAPAPSTEAAIRGLGPDHLAGRLRLDFIRNRARHFFVVIELHRVGGAAAGHRAQIVNIAEHLRQRYMRAHNLGAAALLRADDLAAAAIEVAEHIAEELRRARH